MHFNIPNALTLTRLVLIPVFFWLWSNGNQNIAIVVLFVAGLTDYFDGFLARKLNQATHFGAIFDPIADRILAVVFFSYFLLNHVLPVWFCAIVLIRNFSQMMSVPLLIWWLKKTFHVKPKRFAKWASAISDIFIILPFCLDPESWLIKSLIVIIAYMELKILITYLPRLIQIARGTHDTFE